MVTAHQVSGAVHYPAAGLDRPGGAAAKHQLGSAVVIDDIGEMIHDHVVQARGDRPVLRFRQHPDEVVAGLGGQPGAEFCAVPNSPTAVSLVPSYRRDAFRAMPLTSAPRHHRRVPAG